MLGKDKLIYDGTTPADGDRVAAFLHATLKLTSTTVGGSEALDVNVVAITGQYAEDDAHVSGDLGTQMLGVRSDAGGSLVSADGDYSPFSIDANGRLRVAADIDVVSGFEKAEDAAHASGDIGAYVLAVRQDTLSASAADGDYASFKLDALGRLWTAAQVSGDVADDAADSGNPLKTGTRAVSGALAAVSATGDRADSISDLYRRHWVNTSANIAGSNAAVSVDTTAGGIAVFASPLAGRRKVQVQNLGNKAIFIGFGTVTAANGMRIAGGATQTLEDFGPDLALKAIAESGTQDVRVLQLA